MPPLSIAELRSSSVTSLPERSYSLCLAQKLVAEVQALTEERGDLAVDVQVDQDTGEPAGPPRRIGQGIPPRVNEIDKRLTAIYEEMREHTGELLLRAVEEGEWRRWADEHPPREGNIVDQTAGYGFVNATDLLQDLEKYTVSWNGDSLGADDWAFIRSKAAAGDLKEIVKIVVQMHEGVGSRAPKSPSPSSTRKTNGTGSA